jgi:hypothetical protein
MAHGEYPVDRLQAPRNHGHAADRPFGEVRRELAELFLEEDIMQSCLLFSATTSHGK